MVNLLENWFKTDLLWSNVMSEIEWILILLLTGFYFGLETLQRCLKKTAPGNFYDDLGMLSTVF